jgi:hypothetical protein
MYIDEHDLFRRLGLVKNAPRPNTASARLRRTPSFKLLPTKERIYRSVIWFRPGAKTEDATGSICPEKYAGNPPSLILHLYPPMAMAVSEMTKTESRTSAATA